MICVKSNRWTKFETLAKIRVSLKGGDMRVFQNFTIGLACCTQKWSLSTKSWQILSTNEIFMCAKMNIFGQCYQLCKSFFARLKILISKEKNAVKVKKSPFRLINFALFLQSMVCSHLIYPLLSEYEYNTFV